MVSRTIGVFSVEKEPSCRSSWKANIVISLEKNVLSEFHTMHSWKSLQAAILMPHFGHIAKSDMWLLTIHTQRITTIPLMLWCVLTQRLNDLHINEKMIMSQASMCTHSQWVSPHRLAASRQCIQFIFLVSAHAGQNRELCLCAHGCLPGTLRCTNLLLEYKTVLLARATLGIDISHQCIASFCIQESFMYGGCPESLNLWRDFT